MVVRGEDERGGAGLARFHGEDLGVPDPAVFLDRGADLFSVRPGVLALQGQFRLAQEGVDLLLSLRIREILREVGKKFGFPGNGVGIGFPGRETQALEELQGRRRVLAQALPDEAQALIPAQVAQQLVRRIVVRESRVDGLPEQLRLPGRVHADKIGVGALEVVGEDLGLLRAQVEIQARDERGLGARGRRELRVIGQRLQQVARRRGQGRGAGGSEKRRSQGPDAALQRRLESLAEQLGLPILAPFVAVEMFGLEIHVVEGDVVRLLVVGRQVLEEFFGLLRLPRVLKQRRELHLGVLALEKGVQRQRPGGAAQGASFEGGQQGLVSVDGGAVGAGRLQGRFRKARGERRRRAAALGRRAGRSRAPATSRSQQGETGRARNDNDREKENHECPPTGLFGAKRNWLPISGEPEVSSSL